MTDQELKAARDAEYQAEVAAAKSSFEAYWAGSASASIRRDVRAGRVVTIKAGERAKQRREIAQMRGQR